MSDQTKRTPSPPTPEIKVRTMKPEEREKFWAKKKKDNLQRENLSRGAIGYVSSSTNPQKAKITEGTLHDTVLPPSKSLGIKNANSTSGREVSDEEMKERIKREREAGLVNKRIAEESTKKLRMKMQGFKYTPPDDLKDVPFLQDDDNDGKRTHEDVSKKQTDSKQGEQIIEDSGLEAEEAAVEGEPEIEDDDEPEEEEDTDLSLDEGEEEEPK